MGKEGPDQRGRDEQIDQVKTPDGGDWLELGFHDGLDDYHFENDNHLYTIYGVLAPVLTIPSGSRATLMQAGRPLWKARSSAGPISAGSSTYSP